MSDSTVWVGLDLGLRRTRVSVVDAFGAELLNDECETNVDALKTMLGSFPPERIGLIAAESGNDTHIVRKLRQSGFPVAIFEARQASKFLAIRRNKTDAGDAKGLADLARLGRNSVSQVYLKSPECQQLRGLLVMRRALPQSAAFVHGSAAMGWFCRQGAPPGNCDSSSRASSQRSANRRRARSKPTSSH